MRFYYYCFYRLTNAYKVLDEKDPEMYARGLVTLCQSLNLLSLIAIPFIINNSQYPLELVVIIILLTLMINWFFVLNKKKYIQLEERWKGENVKYKKLKLYLIWFYVLLSLIVYMVTLSIMFGSVSDLELMM